VIQVKPLDQKRITGGYSVAFSMFLDTPPILRYPLLVKNQPASQIEERGTDNGERRTLLWLALHMTPGLGAARARKLAAEFGGVERVFEASLTELEAAGLRAVSAQSIGTGRSLQLAEEELGKASGAGATVLTLDDEKYPRQLLEIYDPPIALYVRGDASVLTEPGIAMVGTRHPTPYGLGMAERLGCDLTARGLIIISGLARGIDTASHRAAVAAKGRTVAVLGTGVDVIYPRENNKLAEQILVCGGAIVSEFPVGTFAAPQNFPIRNRIISGLAAGVLVVEAGEYSGTRITSRCALEQNRDVYAVPGNVTNKNSWTPNTLIKQGAKLVATWEDVWEDLPSAIKLRLGPEPSASGAPSESSLFATGETLAPHEKKILALLKCDEATQLDELVERLEGQMASSEIFAALFELELSGKVRQMPGKNYVKSF
jgi:DNA processing protein